MQKLLYPYLPPGMQNPETFEWMLKSPDARKHLSSMLAQQVRGYPVSWGYSTVLGLAACTALQACLPPCCTDTLMCTPIWAGAMPAGQSWCLWTNACTSGSGDAVWPCRQ